MPLIAAPFLATALVLFLAGMAKVIRPDDTARALIDAGLSAGPLRPGRRSVRAAAGLEAVLAVVSVLVPAVAGGVIVATAYASFAIFVVVALRRGWALSSCGCFAKADTRPTYGHATLNLTAAAAGVIWAASGPSRLVSHLYRSPWHGSALGVVSLVIAGLAYAIWTNPVESLA